jgi:transposase InsO family protein
MQESAVSKTLRARELGISRSQLYYHPKQPDKDWALKCRIEEVLRKHPSYGSPRVALALGRNHKPVERVMKLFSIKAYRRRGKRWKRPKKIKVVYQNLLMSAAPAYPSHIWTADFTHVNFKCQVVYIATVIDLYTRQVVGLSVYTTHGVQLVLSAFMNALLQNRRPTIFHSDNGSEYNAEVFISALETVGTVISRSAPGCPWENGYQESFHSQFKVDLGDPGRFKNPRGTGTGHLPDYLGLQQH